MDRNQLLAEIAAQTPVSGELSYFERWGEDLRWRCLDPGAPLPTPQSGDAIPDAWLFYGGRWPEGDPERLAAHLDDLLAEMDSMCGGQDRCRWPLDQPYPLSH